MFNPLRSSVRILGFCRKEMIQVWRQTGLVTVLLLGPVLILLLFGIGFRSKTRLCRTIFIAKQDAPLTAQVYGYAPSMDHGFIFLGVFHDLPAARRKLQQNEVDLVVVVPENAGELIGRNQQPVFTLLHNALNPSESESIRLRGEILVNELNRWLLNQAVERGREQLQSDVKESIRDANEIRKALEHADLVSARELELRLDRKLKGIGRAIRSRIEALEAPDGDQLRALLSNMADLRSLIESPLVPEAEKKNYAEDIEKAGRVENGLMVLAVQLSQLREIDAHLMLFPISSRVESIRPTQPGVKDAFSPLAIVLLLQHLTMTFGALSLVREFKPGQRELFRAAPLNKNELLLGKYLGYLLLCGVVACVVTGLIVYVLRVPMMGAWLHYAFAIGALLVASLGLGFVISGLSASAEQAVHYSMLVFIATVFFAGVLLNPDMIWAPVRSLSWSLPATYGIQLVQDVMLRGNPLDPMQLAILAGFGATFYVIASMLCGSKMSRT